MNRPILVTGATGQVGSEVVRALLKTMPGVPVAAPGRGELDLANPDTIRRYVRVLQPLWIVSCAAYTGVDAAENDREATFAANATAPGVLAEEAARSGAGLIHLSTDYVFDGSGDRAWLETDATSPRNVYGATKLAGEEAIAAAASNTSLPYVILRTSWVYSGGGKNFVRTMLRLLSTQGEPVRVVADQHGSPTAATDIARVVAAILQAENAKQGTLQIASLGTVSGIYHCAGTGETTWAGLAEAVREYLRVQHGFNPPAIVPVLTTEYPTPAVRPLNSRLNCDKLAAAFGIRLPHWRDSLGDALRELASHDLQPVKRTLESAEA